MDKNQIKQALQKVLESKGTKKFTQSVEAIFNFRGVDVSKPENRINLDVQLPKGRGREVPVVVFAEQKLALDAKKAGIKDIFGKAEIEGLKSNPKKLKKLAKACEFIASPQLMIEVGKNLGQVLGSAGRLPKPIAGEIEPAIAQAKSRVRIMTRGKYLPTVQCAIGTEKMEEKDLLENFDAVYEKIKGKVGEPSIASVYLKMTMSPAVKITAPPKKEKN
ncbi:50S ribosomal protein L1 [Candidatus Micrarchaeota archaeon CG10_big_fil_rev_8_21_14_0_10_45_29]|nr:MAG: 50S ribosomal protein L1 [Candidatus Micrarchaeota archaeon CG10_big_fil_rev_8_21_14_0_10_45_29]